MNIEEIKRICNSTSFSLESRETMILRLIAKDKKAVPYIIEMLNSERQIKNNIISDMNVELSRSLVFIEENTEETKKNKKLPIEKQGFSRTFVVNSINDFWNKYKDHGIGNLFKNK